MPLFSFRKSDAPSLSRTPRGPDAGSAAVQAETVEALRRRARHRLLGASVLVLAAVFGFPLLFDSQPRPVSVDVPITIPDRDKVKPLTVPAVPANSAPVAVAASAPVQGTGPVGATASLAAREELVPPAVAAPPAKPAASVATGATKKEPAAAAQMPVAPVSERNQAIPSVKPSSGAIEKVPEKAPSDKTQPKADDGARARALLDGQDPAASGGGRFIVQIGAFADATKAREVRLKVERAGLKTYTHVIETGEGKRIRVRVGPYPTRAEADKAAGRIRALDLPAAILTL